VLKALLFDLDGTLLDTPQAIVDVAQATLARVGRAPVDVQRIRDGIGAPLPVALAALLDAAPGDRITADAVDHYRVIWRAEVTPRLAQLVFPGVRDGLVELRALGLRTAVVTGKSQEGADGTVDGAGLRPLIDVTLGYTSVPNPKPAPDMALEAMRRLGVAASDCLVVGDARLDIDMARAAGMRSVAVTFGAQLESALRESAPTWMARSFAEVVSIARAALE
jgi:phosphoglycolate phosphatase